VSQRFILALDGHDGSGKTSIAAGVAARLNANVVKPFNAGLGDYIAHLWGASRYAEADRAARFALRLALETEGNLVFDRHWMTMATVLPAKYLEAWRPFPTTVLCWTDLSTTLERLARRGEDIGDVGYHRHYIPKYLRIAHQTGVSVVETTELSVDQAVERVLGALSPTDRRSAGIS
jgi:thymidylate kinase